MAMNFKHSMKNYYSREIQHHRTPGDLPEILTFIVPEKTTRQISSLCLTIAFNGVAALLILLQVFVFSDYKTPMADALKAANERYNFNEAIHKGLNFFQKEFKYYKN
jgi:hypothetical protein